MRKNIVSIIVAAGLLGGAASVGLETDAAAQSSTSGALRGVIKDKKTGETLVGATVVATSSALQGEQVVITDESGLYFVDNLPPGLYTLTVFYNEAKFSRGNVLIQVGKQVVVNVPIDTSTGPGGETIVIEGHAPIVDQGSTKTGTTITKDFTNNIPVGRTFGAVLGSAAGSQNDTFGASFQGSTSLESTYIVEGLNTTDTAFGGISTNLPNEFIQETELITGGYNAEFGRSTGAVVNVVTKSGSNEFHGTVYGYFTPGSLVADSRPIIREGQAISTETNLDYSYDVGGELGGPIIKDKLWFHVGVNPSQRKRTTDRIVSTFRDTDLTVDLDGDGTPDIVDALPDVDPNTGFTISNEVARSQLGLKDTTYFYTAKINGALSQNHQFQISGWGNPRSATNLYAPSSAPSQARIGLEDGSYDASVKWTSKFGDGGTQIDAVAGFHRGYEDDLPIASSDPRQDGTAPYTFFNYERSLTDFANFDTVPADCNVRPTDTDGVAECAVTGGACTTTADCDTTDPTDVCVFEDTDFNNCPVNLYGIGGVGFYEQRTNDRLSGAVSITQRVKAGPGTHTLKAGFEVEQTGYDSQRGLTGGVYYRHSASGTWRRRSYLGFDDNGTIDCGPAGDETAATCTQLAILAADTKNVNLGAYLQDSWAILPNLTLNAGIRWEQQTGHTASELVGQPSPSGELIPDVAFELKNQWAPRIGLIYDPTQEGRSKIYGHWGRFYETMPMDINVRAFGGEAYYTENATRRDFDDPTMITCPSTPAPTGVIDPMSVDPTTIDACPRRLTGQPGGPSILGGGIEYVAPGTKGQYLDEAILGAEYEFMPDFKLGINYVSRRLPIVIEDMSADSANYYLIGNPGENYDDVAADLHQTALDQGLETTCVDADDTNDMTCGLAFENEARSFNVGRIKYFDKPSRNYDALQLTANQRFSKNALMVASYTYSREFGNFPGLYSTETDQKDPNLTSMYDLQDLMANRYGPMGLDRPHNLKLDTFYQFDLKSAGIFVIGLGFRAQSGIPVNTLGAHFVYTDRESFVLPRGAVARIPYTWQADIKAQYGYKIGKNMRLDAFVDIFNLFNNQKTTFVDEQYTVDSINPIVGGDASDLVHGKALDPDVGTQTGTTALKYKNFNNEVVHQAPLSMRFGLRLSF